jgi:hypothetical protein
MSLSSILLQNFSQEPEKLKEWERLNFDLQVTLAWCDGDLAPEERQGLLIRTQLLDAGEAPEARLAMWTDLIQSQGIEHVTGQVFAYYRQLALSLDEDLKAKINAALLQEVLHTVLADQVVQASEHRFVTEQLAPLLKLTKQQAEDALRDAVAGLVRAHRYAAFAFEIYMLAWDAAGDSPAAIDLPDAALTGFPASVRALTEHKRLGSATVVNYFMSMIGGVAVIEQHAQFRAMIEKIADEGRARAAAASSLDVYLMALVNTLRADDHDPTEAVDTVFNHLVQVLGLLNQTTRSFRKIFQSKVLPAFNVDYAMLLNTARSLREVNVLLYQNLTDEEGHAFSAEAPRKHWWQLWKR